MCKEPRPGATFSPEYQVQAGGKKGKIVDFYIFFWKTLRGGFSNFSIQQVVVGTSCDKKEAAACTVEEEHFRFSSLVLRDVVLDRFL